MTTETMKTVTPSPGYVLVRMSEAFPLRPRDDEPYDPDKPEQLTLGEIVSVGKDTWTKPGDAVLVRSHARNSPQIGGDLLIEQHAVAAKMPS